MANASSRHGSDVGTDETWRRVRASWKGEDVVWEGSKTRVPNGVNSRGFFATMLLSLAFVQ